MNIKYTIFKYLNCSHQTESYFLLTFYRLIKKKYVKHNNNSQRYNEIVMNCYQPEIKIKFLYYFQIFNIL